MASLVQHRWCRVPRFEDTAVRQKLVELYAAAVRFLPDDFKEHFKGKPFKEAA